MLAESLAPSLYFQLAFVLVDLRKADDATAVHELADYLVGHFRQQRGIPVKVLPQLPVDACDIAFFKAAPLCGQLVG